MTEIFFERHWHHCAEEASIDTLQLGHGSVGCICNPFESSLTQPMIQCASAIRPMYSCSYEERPHRDASRRQRMTKFCTAQTQPAIEAMYAASTIGSNSFAMMPSAARSLITLRSV